MAYRPVGDDLYIFDAQGPRFNEKMRRFTQRAKAGDVFFIDQIKVKMPGGEIRLLPSLAFQVI